MGTTTKSTTVTFAIVGADGATEDILVELDEELNNEKSTFLPTDTAYFLVFTNPPDLAINIDTTMGTIASLGSKSVAKEDMLQFVQTSSETLGYIPSSAVTAEWIGRSGGSTSVSGSTVSVPELINGILKCNYDATAQSYSISGVTIPAGMEEVEVLIVVSPVV